MSSFQIVRYLDARFQLEWAIQEPDISGFRMVTVVRLSDEICNPDIKITGLFCPVVSGAIQ
jgi:hypothetical protein